MKEGRMEKNSNKGIFILYGFIFSDLLYLVIAYLLQANSKFHPFLTNAFQIKNIRMLLIVLIIFIYLVLKWLNKIFFEKEVMPAKLIIFLGICELFVIVGFVDFLLSGSYFFLICGFIISIITKLIYIPAKLKAKDK